MVLTLHVIDVFAARIWCTVVVINILGLGPVSPFDAAAVTLAVGLAIIMYTWPENYGDPSGNKGLLSQFQQAAAAIASGKNLLVF